MTFLSLYSGDDATLSITATADLTGSTLYWVVKRSMADADSAALVTITSPGIAISGKTAVVTVTAAQTSLLPTDGVCYWSLRDRDATALVRTLASGTLLAKATAQRSVP